MTRLPEKVWEMVLQSIPIPCVDVIIARDFEVLIGFRVIEPYRNVWALPGGRILKSESPEEAVRRTIKEIGIVADIQFFVGVFPIRFPKHPQKRYDIPLCYVTKWKKGKPRPTSELTRFSWVTPQNLPKRIGRNYRKMIKEAFSSKNENT